MYRFHIVIKACFFCVLSFVIAWNLSAQDVNTTEIENDLLKDKIFRFLGNIPQHSKNLYVGPVNISPSFEITETFDDNVFGAPNDKVGDFYTTYLPELGLSLPFLGRHSLSLDYKAEIFEHYRIQQRHRVNQYLNGSLNLNFSRGFSIRLSNRIAATRTPIQITRRTNETVAFPEDGEEPPPEDDEILEEFVFNTPSGRRDITSNNASVVIDLPDFFHKFDFSLSYSNLDVAYQRPDNDGSERNTHTIGGRITMRPLPKINIVTGFDYMINNYDNPSNRIVDPPPMFPDDPPPMFAPVTIVDTNKKDSTHRSIPFDISWQPTRKSNFFLNARYNIRHYGSESIYENFEGWDATLGYRFDVTDRDNLTIKAERSLREQQFRTSEQRLPNGDTFRVGNNNPSFFTQINFDYIHRFNRNLSLSFSPRYQNRRFRESVRDADGDIILRKEKIDTVGLRISARYDAPRKWFFGEISYSIEDRKSNLPSGDMVRNEGRISMGLNF